MNDNQTMLEVAAGLMFLLGLPFLIYWLMWALGRAWYAGRLSAIRRAFHLTKGKRPWSRKSGSGTNREKRMP